MKPYIKKALKFGVISAIVFGLVKVALDFFLKDDFELWGFVFKTLLFGVFMSIYFYFNFKKQSEKELKL